MTRPSIDTVYTGSSFSFNEIKDSGDITLTIAGFRMHKYDDDPKPKCILNFEETEQELNLNSINADTIGDGLGTRFFDEWGGGKIVIYGDPNVRMGKKLVGGVRVRRAWWPDSGKGAAAPAAKPGYTEHIKDGEIGPVLGEKSFESINERLRLIGGTVMLLRERMGDQYPDAMPKEVLRESPAKWPRSAAEQVKAVLADIEANPTDDIPF